MSGQDGGVKGLVEGVRYRVGRPEWLAEAGLTFPPDLVAALTRAEERGDSPIVLWSDRPLAVFALADQIRPSARVAVRALQEMGIVVVMVTGDAEAVARTVAQELGIAEYYARVLPPDKAALVERWRAVGERVAFVGDGINDAPALVAADLGGGHWRRDEYCHRVGRCRAGRERSAGRGAALTAGAFGLPEDGAEPVLGDGLQCGGVAAGGGGGGPVGDPVAAGHWGAVDELVDDHCGAQRPAPAAGAAALSEEPSSVVCAQRQGSHRSPIHGSASARLFELAVYARSGPLPVGVLPVGFSTRGG